MDVDGADFIVDTLVAVTDADGVEFCAIAADVAGREDQDIG